MVRNNIHKSIAQEMRWTHIDRNRVVACIILQNIKSKQKFDTKRRNTAENRILNIDIQSMNIKNLCLINHPKNHHFKNHFKGHLFHVEMYLKYIIKNLCLKCTCGLFGKNYHTEFENDMAPLT